MDIIFQKGSYQNFNSSTFDEGSVCFVNQLVNNEKNYDYIYRIGTNNIKIPLLGWGYSFENKGSEFKVLKDTFNCNDKVKLGEMIDYEWTDVANEKFHSWSIPSIQGCGSIKNGEKAGDFFILDVEAAAGGIVPHPNKKLTLGAVHAGWYSLYLKAGMSCEGEEQEYTDSEGNKISKKNNIQIKDQCYKLGGYSYPGIIAKSGKMYDDHCGRLFFLDTTTDSEDETPGNIIPIRSKLVDLGGASLRWRTVYSQDINASGTISAQSIDASGAISAQSIDASGAISAQSIDASETISTLGDISAKNISVSGDVQEYAVSEGNNVSVKNNIQIKDQCCELDNYSYPGIIVESGKKYDDNCGRLFFLDTTTDSKETIPGNIIPMRPNLVDLGGASLRWRTIYAKNINASGDISASGTISAQSISASETISTLGDISAKNISVSGDVQEYTTDSEGNEVSVKNNIQIKDQCCQLGDEEYSYPGIIVESGKTFNDNCGRLFFLDTTTNSKDETPGNIIPMRPNLVDLGGSSFRWRAIYAKDINASGDISAKNINASETISAKNISVSGDVQEYAVSEGNNVSVKNNIQIKDQCCQLGGYSYPGIIVESGKKYDNNCGRLFFLDTTTDSKDETPGNIIPMRSKLVDLGGASLRWRATYAETIYYTSIGNLSDKRFKEIQPLDILKVDLQVYDSLEPVCYKYKNVLLNDDYSRTHIGFFAQDVAQKIEEAGLTSEECALVQANPLTEETSEELKKICTDGYQYYLNYNELHGLHTLKNHQQDDRLAALEEKNQELENTISELKTQIELFKLAIGG